MRKHPIKTHEERETVVIAVNEGRVFLRLFSLHASSRAEWGEGHDHDGGGGGGDGHASLFTDLAVSTGLRSAIPIPPLRLLILAGLFRRVR